MTLFRSIAPALLLCLASPLFAQNPPPTNEAAAPAPSRDTKLDVPIRLTDGTDAVVTRSRRELGFSLATPDGPVTFAVDKAILVGALKRIGETSFRAEAKNAKPFVYNGIVQIFPGASARKIDPDATADRLIAAVKADPTVTKFTVSLSKTPPIVTAERLNGITGVLARFSTRTSADSNRNVNVGIAAGAIDGTVLSPGETFSLNDTVGERTAARGYKTAHVFVDAKIVDGIGGGVSQVTGTLFNAAALAGLKILEVHPHSRPVAYLPLGRDATVAFGAKDLKFKNDTDGPVYIQYRFVDRRLTATLFGAKTDGRTVELSPVVQRRAPGYIVAQLYRVIEDKASPKPRRERIFRHAYRWKPEPDGA